MSSRPSTQQQSKPYQRPPTSNSTANPDRLSQYAVIWGLSQYAGADGGISGGGVKLTADTPGAPNNVGSATGEHHYMRFTVTETGSCTFSTCNTLTPFRLFYGRSYRFHLSGEGIWLLRSIAQIPARQASRGVAALPPASLTGGMW